METHDDLADRVLAKWQSAMDLLSEVVGVPAALIMRVQGDRLEVFIASAGEANPYHPGDSEPWQGSGLYCEEVIRTRQPLLVPDATASERWKDNPDIKLGMISYLGYPILLPSGEVFGTLCVLDARYNAYDERCRGLLVEFKELVESHLSLAHTNQRLERALAEIETLRGIIPICSYCKKVRDEQGRWHTVEAYVTLRSMASFSHGMCPECRDKHFPE